MRRIHNTYMLAAAWRLAGAMLMDVKQIARDNTALKAALRRDDKFRTEYLALYDLVNTIVDVNQKKFALLATTARTSLTLFTHERLAHIVQHTGSVISRSIPISRQEMICPSLSSTGHF